MSVIFSAVFLWNYVFKPAEAPSLVNLKCHICCYYSGYVCIAVLSATLMHYCTNCHVSMLGVFLFLKSFSCAVTE